MSKKKLLTIREKLLSIPTYGEIAVEEYIRQFEDVEKIHNWKLVPIDSTTLFSTKRLLGQHSFLWRASPQGHEFWEDVYDLIPDEDE